MNWLVYYMMFNEQEEQATPKQIEGCGCEDPVVLLIILIPIVVVTVWVYLDDVKR